MSMTDMEPQQKRPRLSTPQGEYEDDALSALEKLEPLDPVTPNNNPVETQQQGSMTAGRSGVSGISSNQPMQSHANYPGSAAQPLVNSSGQNSVLQELLLNPSNPSGQAMNSPRPPHYTAAYQTRSPLTSTANMSVASNCPQNMALSGGSRNMRPGKPQIYSASHPDLASIQQVNAGNLTHPNQQTSYQMMSTHSGPTAGQQLPYSYQTQAQPQSGPAARSAYIGNARSAAGAQAMPIGRSIVMNGGVPRVRGPHPGLIGMQQNSSIRNVILPQQFESGYMLSGNAIQRAQDPYVVSQKLQQQQQQTQQQQQQLPNITTGYSQMGQIQQSHLVQRGQPALVYGNHQVAQQQATNAPQQTQAMLDHSMIAQQQVQQSGAQNHCTMVNQMNMGGTTAVGPVQSKGNLLTTTSQQAFAQIPPATGRETMQSTSAVNANPVSQDLEKRKLIQQQLVLLLHAHKCQQRERSGAMDINGHSRCTLPHCTTMKSVLTHMIECTSGRTCTYAHCASSRQILSHWKNCSREDCPVCKPLKNIHNTSPGAERRTTTMGTSHQQPSASDNFSTNPVASGATSLQNISQHPLSQTNLAVDVSTNRMNQLSHPNVGTGSAGLAFGVASGCVVSGPGSINNNIGASANNIVSGGGGGGGAAAMNIPSTSHSISSNHTPLSQQSGAPSISSAPSIPDYQSIQSCSSNDPFRSANPPNKAFGRISDQENMSRLVPQDVPPSAVKEWHSAITKDLRTHLIYKLVQAIFPSPDPSAVADTRIHDLILYAKNVERDMFMSANDRDEYYHLLAEKIYKVQKELIEKKSKRDLEASQYFCSQESEQLTQPTRTTCPTTGIIRQQGGTGVNAALGASKQEIVTRIKQEIKKELPDGYEDTKEMKIIITTENASQGCSVVASTSALTGQSSLKMEEAGTSLNAASSVNQRRTARLAGGPSGTSQSRTAPNEQEVELPEKVFDPKELEAIMQPVLDKLRECEEAGPFLHPVDPKALNIPDYYDVVRKPMDLSTISNKLENAKYRNPREVCEDVWLMFDNAWTYNRKNSKVYKYSTKLSEVFTEQINQAMRKMGYCCGFKLAFTPLALFCYGQSMCTIGRDQPYYVYENSTSQFNVVVSEKYTYCVKCFDALPEAGISLSDNPDDTSNMVPKSAFKSKKNDQIEYEPLEKCKSCFRSIHRICALYNKVPGNNDIFICDTCRKEKNIPLPENRYTAKRLPHCNLSRFIEERVNKYLSNHSAGRDCEVIIRVLCTSDKEVEVKQMMVNKYGPLGFPAKFPYRSKAIFAFEIIDGVEVCFFGLHVQEYGSDCSPPNQKRVYIAYLDSVNFFQPKELRTEIYHEILLGYLQYVAKGGFTMAHIWACPPSEGDDYIFHCHPPEMKIPKPKRLQDWYKKMLEKGISEGTVYMYKDIYRQARDDNLTTPMSLPYFEGDFWPNVIEDCIKEVEQDEEERKRQEEQQQNADDDEDIDVQGTSDNVKNSSKKTIKRKNNVKKVKSKKKIFPITGNQVADKLFGHLDKHKEVFFTIRLATPQLDNEIKDPDSLIACDLMDGRDTFLTRAREEHWEFSSLRRAKYSTLCFTYSLHAPDNSQTLTCNKCNKSANWHCNECDDFDLCTKCYNLTKHEHQMENVVVPFENERPNTASSRNESIQRVINSLVHACHCRDANCRRTSCHRMKRIVTHTKTCKKRAEALCQICKQVIALICYHARHCEVIKCNVPFCASIRKKLQDQKRSANRRADMLMRRRIEMLHSANQSAQSTSTNQASTSSVPTLQTSGNNGGSQSAGKPVYGMQRSNSASTTSALHMQQGSAPLVPGQMNTNATIQKQIHMGQQQQIMVQHQQQMNQLHSMQPQPYHGGGMNMMNGANGGNGKPQQHAAKAQMQQHHVQQIHPNVRSSVQQQIGSMQGRISVQGTSVQQPQQQTMNPPPYARSAMQGGYMANASGPTPQYRGHNQAMMMNQTPQLQSSSMMHQQHLPRQKMYASQVVDSGRSNPGLSEIQAVFDRFKNCRTNEEQDQVLADMKKSPHLYASVLKFKTGNADVNQITSLQGMQQQPVNTLQQQNMMRQSQMMNQQGTQWQQGQTLGLGGQSQAQYYQQQQASAMAASGGQVQTVRGPGGQYPPSSLLNQTQVAANVAQGQTPQAQWQQQFQRGSQPVSPAVQQQFNQVRSPSINGPSAVSGLAPSPMMTSGGSQQMQSQGPPDTQSYR